MGAFPAALRFLVERHQRLGSCVPEAWSLNEDEAVVTRPFDRYTPGLSSHADWPQACTEQRQATKCG